MQEAPARIENVATVPTLLTCLLTRTSKTLLVARLCCFRYAVVEVGRSTSYTAKRSTPIKTQQMIHLAHNQASADQVDRTVFYNLNILFTPYSIVYCTWRT